MLFDPNAPEYLCELDYALFMGASGTYKSKSIARFPHADGTLIAAKLLSTLSYAELSAVMDHVVSVLITYDTVDIKTAMVIYAALLSSKREDIRKDALSAFHLLPDSQCMFEVLHYALNMRGWGRGLRRAVLSWYEEQCTRLDAFIADVVSAPRFGKWDHASVTALVRESSGVMLDVMHFLRTGSIANLSTENAALVSAFNRLRNAARFSSISAEDIRDAITYGGFTPAIIHTTLLRRLSTWAHTLRFMTPYALSRAAVPMAKLGMSYDSSASRLLRAEYRSVVASCDRTQPAMTEYAMITSRRARSRDLASFYMNPMQLLAHKFCYSMGHKITRSGHSRTWDVQTELLVDMDLMHESATRLLPQLPTNTRIYCMLSTRGSVYNAHNVSMGHMPDMQAVAALVHALYNPSVRNGTRLYTIVNTGVRALSLAVSQSILYGELGRSVLINRAHDIDVGETLRDGITRAHVSTSIQTTWVRHVILILYTRLWRSELYDSPESFISAHFAATGVRLRMVILVVDRLVDLPVYTYGDVLYISGVSPEVLPIIHRFMRDAS